MKPSLLRHSLCAFGALLFLLIAPSVLAQTASTTFAVHPDLPYKTGASAYEEERCKLDLFVPNAQKGFATIVWFHGGGLTGGSKDLKNGRAMAQAGIAMAVPNYRLSPKATYPAYIEDAAAAFAWTKTHIAEYGGDPNKIFIGGVSAGGYLTFMLGMDPRYLQAHHLELSSIAGLIPVSGQVMTHYTIREERGISRYTITADEAAPVFYTDKNLPPMLILYGDHDMAARAEENLFLIANLKGAGNKMVTGLMIPDRTHGAMCSQMADPKNPERLAILAFIQAQSASAH